MVTVGAYKYNLIQLANFNLMDPQIRLSQPLCLPLFKMGPIGQPLV